MLRLLLAGVDGDVATLCAAACVAQPWRAAAAEPSLWRRPTLSQRVREAMTDARVKWLVARAGARGPVALDLRGCVNVTAAGVAVALLPPDKVTRLRDPPL